MNDTKLSAALKEALREVSGMMVELAGAGSDEHMRKEAREAGLAASMAIMDIALDLAAPVLPPAPARVGESANGVTQDDLMRMAREASIADGLELPHEIEAIMNFARAIESAIAAQAGGTVPIEEEICAEAYEAMLAAAPIAPVRQPLTDAQIIAGAKADWVDEFKDFQCGVKFAEHHHGIK